MGPVDSRQTEWGASRAEGRRSPAFRTRPMLLAGVAALAVLGMPAQAQENTQQAAGAPPAEAQDKQGRVTVLQRVVVSAGQAKVAIDVPQAVSVVDQEDIDNL